ncbi:MAG: RloB domain-containing protein [Saprospirales bacterium]|nr:RloB domain-containing protein [Saprospirales bacterium]MBK6904836.1 RloB domain-containing protein [Saprospirales bacterium]MBK7338358.1 RloB domain-containing protein [Saprospirales bacterium]
MKRSSKKVKRVKKRILILCEGLTEKNYFQAIKEDPDYSQALLAVNPQVVAAKSPTPEQVVREALQRAQKAQEEGNAYDKVWVVFDHDHHIYRKTAYEQAQKSTINVGFSAISFETWFLLHFVRSAKVFETANALLTELRKYYQGYQKARQNDFSNLKDKLETALSNTTWLKSQTTPPNKHITDCNPWTDVDVLVLELIRAGE